MKKDNLKKLLKEKEIIISPGCHDPLSAKVVDSLGFDATYLGGYAVGASLGITEPLTTLTEMVDLSRLITDFIDIPLILDAGAGWGNSPMVYRAIKQIEKAGVSGIHIEDQVVPKRLAYHKEESPGKKQKLELVSVEEMVFKIETCLKARTDDNFIVIARTDAGRGKDEDFQVAIERANIYAKAGADLVMVFPRNLEEIKLAPKKIDANLLFIGSEGLGRPVPGIEDLKRFGYKIVIYPTTSILVATEAIKSSYLKLKQEGVTGNMGSNGLEGKHMEEVAEEIMKMLSLDDLYNLETLKK